MEVWKPDDEKHAKRNKCRHITTPTFPFLDMQLQWTIHGALSFRAYSKPSQRIQYVDKSSTHHRSCLTSIPHGVLKRLGRLTSNDQSTHFNQSEYVSSIKKEPQEHFQIRSWNLPFSRSRLGYNLFINYRSRFIFKFFVFLTE